MRRARISALLFDIAAVLAMFRHAIDTPPPVSASMPERCLRPATPLTFAEMLRD
jgi:hypothetical protein